MGSPVAYQCVNHPGRPAIGVCVKCQAPVCPDCTTKVQGINHCLSCLQLRVKPTDTSIRRPPPSVTPAGIAAAFAFFVLVFALLGAAFVAAA
ncbi:MAG: B-box zinc finger protein [Planctomycetota bacterium]